MYVIGIMVDIDGIKEELDDIEVNEENPDPLSLESTQFTGK